MKKFDVVALGELLIDFIQNGISEENNPIMEANAGGAPCNVLSMLTKLNRKTAFIGKVGNDYFGNFLKDCISNIGIDTSNLIMDNYANTTLAFVNKLPNGDRDFTFYRNNTADTMLKKEEIQTDIIKNTKIFHFGTLSLTHEPSKEATKYAIDIAKSNNVLISFDPNIRKPLWSSLEQAKLEMKYGLSQCDILKISDDEVEFLTGTSNYDYEILNIQQKYNIPIIFLTLGKLGSKVYYKDFIIEEKGIIQENIMDTTGAGDTFLGCILNELLNYDINALDTSTLHNILKFANSGASLITQRRGALKVMPLKKEIDMLMTLSQK